MFADNSTSTSSKKDLLSAPDRVNGMGKSPPYDVNPLYKMVKLLENISVSMTCVSSTFSYEIALHKSYVTLVYRSSEVIGNGQGIPANCLEYATSPLLVSS